MSSTFLPPVDVKILIVGDGSIRFNAGVFGLSLLIEALQERLGPIVKFDVKTAYRPDDDTEPERGNRGADFWGFNFEESESDLEKYDQIWLIGAEIYNKDLLKRPTMSDAEIVALFEKMEKGKGVMATGDHQDLGAAMNARIPRVRSMRRWRSDDDIAEDLRAPRVDGPLRHDTLRENNNGKYMDLNEGDEIPQTINLVSFPLPNSSSIYRHPLMDGQNGPIRFFPDHMHEGVCCAPPLILPDLPLSEKEYPTKDRVKVEPQIIATSFAPESHTVAATAGAGGPVSFHEFGAVAVYDGHRIEIGRVAVDSSFHHFANGNLEGFVTSDISGRGLFALEDIKNYFRNLGLWLTPKHKQINFSIRAFWHVRWRSRIYFELKKLFDPPVTHQPASVILALGIEARKILNHLSSPSLTLEWVLNLIAKYKTKSETGDLPPDLHVPWTLVTPPDPALPNEFNLEKLVNLIIGGVIYALAEKFPSEDAISPEKLEEEIEKAIKKGVETGIQSYRETLRESINKMEGLIKGFADAFQLAD